MPHPIIAKRIYETPAPEDGRRVLVDRIWPRGVTREAASIDRWLKEIAPSDELRKWFDHKPGRWDEFLRRYRRELEADASSDLLQQLLAVAEQEPLTLLYSARDLSHNQAVALAGFLRDLASARR
jgi:uncharacterized protein YeaO (DUF488 family)